MDASMIVNFTQMEKLKKQNILMKKILLSKAQAIQFGNVIVDSIGLIIVPVALHGTQQIIRLNGTVNTNQKAITNQKGQTMKYFSLSSGRLDNQKIMESISDLIKKNVESQEDAQSSILVLSIKKVSQTTDPTTTPCLTDNKL